MMSCFCTNTLCYNNNDPVKARHTECLGYDCNTVGELYFFVRAEKIRVFLNAKMEPKRKMAMVESHKERLGLITPAEVHRLSNDDHSDTISPLGSVSSDIGLLIDVDDITKDMLDWLTNEDIVLEPTPPEANIPQAALRPAAPTIVLTQGMSDWTSKGTELRLIHPTRPLKDLLLSPCHHLHHLTHRTQHRTSGAGGWTG